MNQLLVFVQLLGLLFALCCSPGCKRPEPSPNLVVLGASSLIDVLPEVGRAWTQQGNSEIVFSFDSTSRLGAQIGAGAPGDVFIAANPRWMTNLAQLGALKEGSQRELLSNTLVYIIPQETPDSSPHFQGKIQIQGSLGLAGESVPAGDYARQALNNLGLWEGLAPRVVGGDNVRTVLHWVARGEVEGGIVYGSDALADPRVRAAFTFPPSTHEPIRYPGAVLQAATHPDAAASFLRFCQCEAQSIFKARGFEPLPGSCDDPR